MEERVLRFPRHAGDDASFLRHQEWLVTNGLGGYASGTLEGTATRRYHGVFIPNLQAPRGRTVILPRLDEEIHLSSPSKKILLNGVEFTDGKCEGDAASYLTEFRLDWQIPVWTFEFDGRVFEKKIVMPHGQNTTVISYRLVSGDALRLTLQPFLTFRAVDDAFGHPPDWPFALVVMDGRYEIHPFDGAPSLKMSLRSLPGDFTVHQKISENILYSVERARGQGFSESLSSPGYFSAEMKAGDSVGLVLSTEAWEVLEINPEDIFRQEKERLQKLLTLVPLHAQTGLAAQLTLAADQFIILPWNRVEENMSHRVSEEKLRTVIAGYHWFTDWGRDTMISLEGLTLCTGRYGEAEAILKTFSHYVKDGLLPNLFPEGQRTALYHTVDATFWFFHAIDRYYETTGNEEILHFLYPALQSIIEHHLKGTHFGIQEDPRDGLIRAGAEGYQLTWMDAKVEDWVVTPRRGKPVEIQALWYNALKLMEHWSKKLNRPGQLYADLSQKAQDSFNRRFWCEEGKYLYDVIDGEKGDDASLRPNQLFALSLRFPVLDPSRWKPVVDVVADRLFTPYGIRTLDRAHPDYRARYEGDRWARDAAYHQGMVWAWLIGPFLDAWQKVYPNDRTKIKIALEGFAHHLREGGIGSISEIFDPEPPYLPRGCIAKAWSVAEALRTYNKWMASDFSSKTLAIDPCFA